MAADSRYQSQTSCSRDTAHSENEEDEDREEQVLFDRDNTSSVAEDDGDKEEAEGSDNLDGDAGNNNNSGPIYVQSTSFGDKWELSWPIWHMLPRDERRAIATQHGYRTIGEFEEYMSLTRAVDESEGRVQERSGIITLPSVSGGEIADLADGVGSMSVSEEPVQTSSWHPPFANVPQEDDDSSVSSSEDNMPIDTNPNNQRS